MIGCRLEQTPCVMTESIQRRQSVTMKTTGAARARIEPDFTYQLYCSLTPYMRGSLYDAATTPRGLSKVCVLN
jgi:hypothetical protein